MPALVEAEAVQRAPLLPAARVVPDGEKPRGRHERVRADLKRKLYRVGPNYGPTLGLL